MSYVQFHVSGYSLQQPGSIIVSDADHESAPPINLAVEAIPFQDGGKLVSSTFNPKNIVLSGQLIAATQADLDALVDTLKQNCYVVFGDLDVSYAGGYRRFGVTTESIAISRSAADVTICGFSITFSVIDPPFGKAIDALDGDFVVNRPTILTTVTGTLYPTTITFSGTAQPRPIFTVPITSASSLQSIVIKNKTTQQYIEIPGPFSSQDNIIIDTEKYLITKEGNPVNFTGVIPEFNVGSNTVEVFAKDTQATIASNDVYNNTQAITFGNRYGLFYPVITSASGGNKLGHFEFFIAKNEAATGRIQAELWDDAGGDGIPDNLLQTVYVDFTQVAVGPSWVSIDFTDFDKATLNASSGGFAVVLTPETDNGSVIYMPYKNYGITRSVARKKKTESVFAIDATKQPCYRIFEKMLLSSWRFNLTVDYTRRYL